MILKFTKYNSEKQGLHFIEHPFNYLASRTYQKNRCMYEIKNNFNDKVVVMYVLQVGT